jgi:hypothetical protein
MDEYTEGKMGMEEYQRKEKEIERKKVEELGEGESEKEEEEGEGREKTQKKGMQPMISVEMPVRRGRGRPKKGLVDFPETDVEGETGGEGITDQQKMVHSYDILFLFLRYIYIFLYIYIYIYIDFVLYFCLVHMMLGDEVSEDLSDVEGRKEMREVHEGKTNVRVGRGGKIGEYEGRGVEKEEGHYRSGGYGGWG